MERTNAFRLMLIALPFCTSGCLKRTHNQAAPSGYFEEHYTMEQLLAHKGKQRVVAEYEGAQDVILSPEGFPGSLDVSLIQRILDAGAPRVYVLVSVSPSEIEKSGLDLIRQTYASQMGRRVFELKFANPRWDYQRGQSEAEPRISRWARDWGPITAMTPEGQFKITDFNYRNSAGDSSGFVFAQRLGVPFLSLPVGMEGGAFIGTADGDCLVSTQVNWNFGSPDRAPANYVQITRESLPQYFKDYLGCKRFEIFTPPWDEAETEGLGVDHLDMWMKVVANRLAVVNEIWDESIALITTERVLAAGTTTAEFAARVAENGQRIARSVKNSLDKKATRMQALGYKVIRIPMPVPAQLYDFLTYSNSLQIGKTLLTPQYKQLPTGNPYVDGELLPRYEKAVIERLAEEGFQVSFVESDNIITAGGSIHCATMQVGHVEAIPGDTDIQPTPGPTPPPAAAECHVSDADGYTFLREGNGNSAKRGFLMNGVAVTIAGETGDRTLGAIVGYLHASVVSCTGVQCTVNDSDPALENGISGPNFRAAPGGRKIGLLQNGTAVERVGGDDAGWLKVRVQGTVATSRCPR